MFGGEINNAERNYDEQVGDTWTWNGSSWTEQYPPLSPTPRYGAAMAYDAATATSVLFGGVTVTGGYTELPDDTWYWR